MMSEGNGRNNQRLYDLLEVPTDASLEDIKKSYRKLVLKYHPDKNPSQQAAERFQAIFEAYKVLSDENKRFLYDQYGDDYQIMKDSGILTKMIAEFFIEFLFAAIVPFDNISKRSKVERFSNPNMFTMGSKLRNEGTFRGLWRGTFLGIFSSMTYTRVRELLDSPTRSPLLSIVASQIICYPLEVLTTVHRTNLQSVSSACVQIWRQKAFFAGIFPYFLQNTMLIAGDSLINSSRINIWTTEKLRKLLEKKGWVVALAAKLGVILVKMSLITLVTCPFKTIATRMQAITVPQEHTGSWFQAFKMFGTICSNEGFGKLYSGFFSDVIFSTGTFLLNSILGA